MGRGLVLLVLVVLAISAVVKHLLRGQVSGSRARPARSPQITVNT